MASADPTRAGFARILQRHEWVPLVRERGGGAYWSFLERSNSYDDTPELGLQYRWYRSGFAGGERGLILDLGPIPEDRLGAVLSGSPPADLEGRRLDAWNFLHDVRASVESGRRALSPADDERAAQLGFDRRPVPANVGHTYLLRAVAFQNHDHLVAFTVIGEDEAGHSLAWRILRSWAVEQPPRNR